MVVHPETLNDYRQKTRDILSSKLQPREKARHILEVALNEGPDLAHPEIDLDWVIQDLEAAEPQVASQVREYLETQSDLAEILQEVYNGLVQRP